MRRAGRWRDFTVTDILARSSNVGDVTLGLKVGKTRLVEMIEKLGFTEKLGVDFPGESTARCDCWRNGTGTTIANVPIGQGIAVTPLQLAAAYSAIANDGLMVQPHLLKGMEQPWSRRVISETVAAQLREMLSVTVEDGTGTLAASGGLQGGG